MDEQTEQPSMGGGGGDIKPQTDDHQKNHLNPNQHWGRGGLSNEVDNLGLDVG